MKKAFTIAELLIAVMVMALTMTGSGYIFKIAIDAQRTAGATAEIMRNLRGITDQIDSDFRGVRTDVGPWIYFWVVEDPSINDPNQWRRDDRMRFVSNGDFQTVRQYGDPNKTIAGNVASICYAQALNPNCFATDTNGRRNKILTRRQTIFAVGAPAIAATDPCEYITESLAQWEAVDIPTIMAAEPNNDAVVDRLTARPTNATSVTNIPLYMAKGVDSFAVQLSNGSLDPNAPRSLLWWPTNQQIKDKDSWPGGYIIAIKFMLRLYDSKGIIKNGMEFTHIVYLKQE